MYVSLHESLAYFFGVLNLLKDLTVEVFLKVWQFKSFLGSIGFSRQARVSAAEYLHEYIVYGLLNQRSDPNGSIGSSDFTYWLLLFHMVFILGADSDPVIR